jgi:hypothetical protein
MLTRSWNVFDLFCGGFKSVQSVICLLLLQEKKKVLKNVSCQLGNAQCQAIILQLGVTFSATAFYKPKNKRKDLFPTQQLSLSEEFCHCLWQCSVRLIEEAGFTIVPFFV